MVNIYRHYNKNIITKFDNKKLLRVLYALQSLRGVCVKNEAWNPQFNKITPKTVNCCLLNKYEPKCKECSKSLIIKKKPSCNMPFKPIYPYKVGQIKAVHAELASA